MLKLRGRRGLKWRSLPTIHFIFRALGLKWSHFYSWMLDQQEKRNTIDEIINKSPAYTGKEKGLYDLSVAKYHVPLLKMCGMTLDSKVLDYGCGFGRSAVHIIPELNKCNYFGIDLSSERIRMANEYIKKEGLENYKPSFYISNNNNTLSMFEPKSFDIVWARAVLCHMPLNEVRHSLKEIFKALNEGGVFVGDYAVTKSEIEKTSIKDYLVSDEIMKSVVEECGFVYEIIEDWQIGIDKEYKRSPDDYKMMMLKKNKIDF